MTFQSKEEIESLINAIDSILPKTNARLPWWGPSEVGKLRLLLEQVRSHLIAIQNKPLENASPEQEAARQISHAVLQEISNLRADLIEPLQAEIQNLRQQRETLVYEIRQLEGQRQALTPQQIQQQQLAVDFLQGLKQGLQESFAEQVAHSLSQLEVNLSPEFFSQSDRASQSRLDSVEPLEQLQQMQSRSDQLFMSLDSTIQVVFETLQRNIQGYQESLSQGLEKMHSLGQQSEVMFAALLNNLKQQLKTEASATFPSSSGYQLGANTSQTAPQPLLPVSDASSEAKSIRPPQTTTGRQFPLPGIELPLKLSKDDNAEDLNLEEFERDLQALGVAPLDEEEIELFLLRGLDALTEAEASILEQYSPEVEPKNQQKTKALEALSRSHEDEIEALYNSLFGEGSLSDDSDTTQADDSQHSIEPKPTNEDNEEITPNKTETEMTNPEGEINSSLGVEEIVFEELSDFIAQPSPEQTAIAQTGDNEEAQPMSDAFGSFAEHKTLGEVENQDREEIETITALTDLFSGKFAETFSLPTIAEEEIEDSSLRTTQPLSQEVPESNTIPAASWIEDTYTPASPEEALFIPSDLQSEIVTQPWLEQELIERLSEDLSNFEETAQNHEEPDQEEPENATEIAVELPQPTQQRGMFNEVVVEDWENEDDYPDLFALEPRQFKHEGAIASLVETQLDDSTSLVTEEENSAETFAESENLSDENSLEN